MYYVGGVTLIWLGIQDDIGDRSRAIVTCFSDICINDLLRQVSIGVKHQEEEVYILGHARPDLGQKSLDFRTVLNFSGHLVTLSRSQF